LRDRDKKYLSKKKEIFLARGRSAGRAHKRVSKDV